MITPLNQDRRYLSEGEYDDLRKRLWNHNTKRLFAYAEMLRERVEALETAIDAEVERRVREYKIEAE